MKSELSLTHIEAAAKLHSQDRSDLALLVSDLNDKIEAFKRASLPAIKRAVAKASASRAALKNIVTDAPALFIRPRTVEFHGLKIGFRKGNGGIDWDDDAKTVELIEKHFSKPQADLLIKTTKKPIKKALEDLDIADLKRIGCRVEDTGDIVVIRPTDSTVDKLVTALLRDALEETQQAEAA